jgi:hypothetical protein
MVLNIQITGEALRKAYVRLSVIWTTFCLFVTILVTSQTLLPGSWVERPKGKVIEEDLNVPDDFFGSLTNQRGRKAMLS